MSICRKTLTLNVLIAIFTSLTPSCLAVQKMARAVRTQLTARTLHKNTPVENKSWSCSFDRGKAAADFAISKKVLVKN